MSSWSHVVLQLKNNVPQKPLNTWACILRFTNMAFLLFLCFDFSSEPHKSFSEAESSFLMSPNPDLDKGKWIYSVFTKRQPLTLFLFLFEQSRSWSCNLQSFWFWCEWFPVYMDRTVGGNNEPHSNSHLHNGTRFQEKSSKNFTRSLWNPRQTSSIFTAENNYHTCWWKVLENLEKKNGNHLEISECSKHRPH